MVVYQFDPDTVHDRALLVGKRGATALGFAVLLKHYSRYGRFPLIQQRPELDQIVNVNPDRLHAAPSFPHGHTPRPPPLVLVDSTVDSTYMRRHVNVHGHYSFQPEIAGGQRELRDPDTSGDNEDM